MRWSLKGTVTILLFSHCFSGDTSAQLVINDRLAVISTQANFNPAPVDGGPAGTFTITSTFRNVSTEFLTGLRFDVTEQTVGNLLLNADERVGGVGSKLTARFTDDYSDGLLSPKESFTVDFIIGLATANQFEFLVNALGAFGALIGPAGGVATEPGGSSVTIEAGSIDYDAVIGIAPARPLERHVRPNPEVVDTELDADETVLLHLEKKTYYSLNLTGTRIWQGLKQSLPLPEISRRLQAEFAVDEERANKSVLGLVNDLCEQNLALPDSRNS